MSSITAPNQRPVGVFRLLFPALVVGLATAVFLLAPSWGTEIESSNISMAKMAAIVVAGVLLFLWALRMPGWRKRYVWLTFVAAIGLALLVFKPVSMTGKFFPIFVARNWVQDTFFGGSPDTLLEQHRQAQGKAEGAANLTEKPGDWPAYRGVERDGVATGPKLSRDWNKLPPKELWRQPVGGGYAAFSIANGFLVTIEQRRDREVVACYEAATGKEAWTAEWNTRFSETAGGDGPRATPTIAFGDVFAYGAKGRLVCLDGKDGKEKWSVETLNAKDYVRWGMSGSPLIVDNLVVVNPGAQTEAAKGRALLAFDRATGKEIWAAGNYAAGYCSPQLATLSGKRQILVFDSHGIAGHDPNGGIELWNFAFKTDFDVNAAQPMVVGDDSLVIAAGYNHGGSRIRVADTNGKWSATEVWRTKNTVMRYKFASGVHQRNGDGDYAYGLNDGILECVDLKTGKAMWKDDRRAKVGEAFGHGQILLASDLIVALTEYGELVLVEANPTAFKELGRIQALTKGPKTWNNPAMANGRIYIRNEEQMACFDLTAP